MSSVICNVLPIGARDGIRDHVVDKTVAKVFAQRMRFCVRFCVKFRPRGGRGANVRKFGFSQMACFIGRRKMAQICAKLLCAAD